MRVKKHYVFIFLLLISLIGYTQNTITGKIIDAETKEPIYGASIYFDGTTIGTISNDSGKFQLTIKKESDVPLIISSLGYKSELIQLQKQLELGVIELEVDRESLEEVFLETDPWSREKKLNYFKEWLLGGDYTKKECKVLNEEDIKLRFSPSSQTLTAYSEKVLLIENKYLGYKINYQLMDFELKFNKRKITQYNNDTLIEFHPNSFYYAGSSFFQKINKDTKRKHLKRREKIFLGSLTHFMRSLSNKKLKENNFKIFQEGREIPPYRYFNIDSISNNKNKIDFLTKKISVLYDNKYQSYIKLIDNLTSTSFYTDNLGNFYPNRYFYISGYMSTLRISSLLPLDYRL